MSGAGSNKPDTQGALDLARRLTGDREAVAHLAQYLAEHLTPPLVYSCQSLAAEVGCSPEAIGRAIRSGELAATRRAGRYVIRAEDVDEWVRTGNRPRLAERRDRPGGARPAKPADTPGAVAILNAGQRAA